MKPLLLLTLLTAPLLTQADMPYMKPKAITGEKAASLYESLANENTNEKDCDGVKISVRFGGGMGANTTCADRQALIDQGSTISRYKCVANKSTNWNANSVPFWLRLREKLMSRATDLCR